MWRSLDGLLLRELLKYLDDDDVYRFWVFAEESGVDRVRALMTSGCGDAGTLFSQTRAWYLAMAYANWTAVRRLTGPPANQQLYRRTVEGIIREIQRHDGATLAHHPDRETAMLTAAPPGSVPAYVTYFAVKLGNLESVIWLHSVARYDPPEALRIAARHGHDHVIVWLLDNPLTAQWVTDCCYVEWAFKREDDLVLDLLAWRVRYEESAHLSAFSPKWGFADSDLWGSADYGVFDLPASQGDLDAMKRMLTHDVFENDNPLRTAKHAARGGHLHVVQWVYDHHPDELEASEILVDAAEHGHLEIVQWAATHVEGDQGAKSACYDAARNGHCHVLQWLTEAFPATKTLHDRDMDLACAAGHLQLIRWFVEEQGVQVTRNHIAQAATGGHMQVFQWLLDCFQRDYQDAVQLEESWLDAAAGSGNLILVRWLVEDCGRWSTTACAAAGGRDVAEYLHSFGLLHNKTQHGLLRGRRGKPLIRDGLFGTLTCLLKYKLFANRLEKRMFDRINNFETIFTHKQTQLGWDDYLIRHEYWPRTPFMMTRLRELIRVVIDEYDPEFLRQVSWLPKWAVLHGTIATLERLAAIGHPKVLSPKLLRLLLRTSSNADKVQWLLIKAPTLFSTHVVRWAVQFDKPRLLSWIFREFMPSTTFTESDTTRFRCIHTVRWFSRKYNRPEIIPSVLSLPSETTPDTKRIRLDTTVAWTLM